MAADNGSCSCSSYDSVSATDLTVDTTIMLLVLQIVFLRKLYNNFCCCFQTGRDLLLLLLLSDSGGLDTGTSTDTDSDTSRSLQRFEYEFRWSHKNNCCSQSYVCW